MNEEKIKDTVRSKYGQIVKTSSCCGTGCCSSGDMRFTMKEDYSHLKGYESIADYGLGCGLPTEYAPVSYTHLRAHETVLDHVCRLLLET